MDLPSVDTFFGTLEKSHLLAPEQWVVARREFVDETDVRPVCQQLIRKGLLTGWQCKQLLLGKHTFFLNKFRLLDQLGRGGMGMVFKAQQITTQRLVALKVISARALESPVAVQRFRREVQAVAALNHPHIITAIDADCAGLTHFLVMEYVEGQDLSAWLAEYEQLPINWVCECLRQTAIGLQHAHERGLVHRDIKPSNILVVADDLESRPFVKILDMGMARYSEVVDDEELTQTGQILGTPDYIAPEQAEDTSRADIRADIFSLGCTLFKVLTGQVPFGGRNSMEKLMARARRDAPLASSLRPGVSPDLDELIARMLERDPDFRPQTPAEVAELLAPFAGVTPRIDLSRLPGDATPPDGTKRAARAVTRTDSELYRFLDQLADTEARARRWNLAGASAPSPHTAAGPHVSNGAQVASALSVSSNDFEVNQPGDSHQSSNEDSSVAVQISQEEVSIDTSGDTVSLRIRNNGQAPTSLNAPLKDAAPPADATSVRHGSTEPPPSRRSQTRLQALPANIRPIPKPHTPAPHGSARSAQPRPATNPWIPKIGSNRPAWQPKMLAIWTGSMLGCVLLAGFLWITFFEKSTPGKATEGTLSQANAVKAGAEVVAWSGIPMGNRFVLDFHLPVARAYHLRLHMLQAPAFFKANVYLDNAQMTDGLRLERNMIGKQSAIDLGTRALSQGPHQLMVELVPSSRSEGVKWEAWQVVGPFDVTGELTNHHAPEKDDDPQSKFTGRDGRMVSWKPIMNVDGDIGELLDARGNYTLYLSRAVNIDRERILPLTVTTAEPIAVWWNGKQVFTRDSIETGNLPPKQIDVTAKPGPNRLLIKLVRDREQGEFSFSDEVAKDALGPLVQFSLSYQPENAPRPEGTVK